MDIVKKIDEALNSNYKKHSIVKDRRMKKAFDLLKLKQNTDYKDDNVKVLIKYKDDSRWEKLYKTTDCCVFHNNSRNGKTKRSGIKSVLNIKGI
jgi:hypothetical protein